jgi:hypothetical protein
MGPDSGLVSDFTRRRLYSLAQALGGARRIIAA